MSAPVKIDFVIEPWEDASTIDAFGRIADRLGRLRKRLLALSNDPSKLFRLKMVTAGTLVTAKLEPTKPLANFLAALRASEFKDIIFDAAHGEKVTKAAPRRNHKRRAAK